MVMGILPHKLGATCFSLGVAPVGWLFDLSVNILQYGDLLINLPWNPP